MLTTAPQQLPPTTHIQLQQNQQQQQQIQRTKSHKSTTAPIDLQQNHNTPGKSEKEQTPQETFTTIKSINFEIIKLINSAIEKSHASTQTTLKTIATMKEDFLLLKQQTEVSIQNLTENNTINDNIIGISSQNILEIQEQINKLNSLRIQYVDLFTGIDERFKADKTEIIQLFSTISALQTQTSSFETRTINSITELQTQFEKQQTSIQKKLDKYSSLEEQLKLKQSLIDGLQEKYTDQQKSSYKLSHDADQHKDSINELKNQLTQLRRWLFAIGGGTTLAIIFFFWHYTHK